MDEVRKVCIYLVILRLIVVNLFWVFERMESVVIDNIYLLILQLKNRLLEEVKEIYREDEEINC